MKSAHERFQSFVFERVFEIKHVGFQRPSLKDKYLRRSAAHGRFLSLKNQEQKSSPSKDKCLPCVLGFIHNLIPKKGLIRERGLFERGAYSRGGPIQNIFFLRRGLIDTQNIDNRQQDIGT